MCDFSSARVGDRVWAIGAGWGNVMKIHDDGIEVDFHYPRTVTFYRIDGKLGSDRYTTLFWDEVKIVPPPKPKRKVKKVVEGYLIVTKKQINDGTFDEPAVAWCTHLFPTPKGAWNHIRGYAEPAGEPIFIRHEYEVEE